MDNTDGLCVFFLLAVASACQHSPSISITPLNLEGLSGSCLQIPCNFRVAEGKDFPGLESSAVWLKNQSQFQKPNSKFVVFNGSRTSHVNYPMKIIGDVKKKNCTTEFSALKKDYTGRYFFRVEDGDFMSTASCDSIHIIVRDSAWSPSIEVSGEQIEAEVVTITCSVVTPCPSARPRLTWDLDKDTEHRLVQNPDGTFNTTITYKLFLTSSHDGCNVTCSAEYPVNDGKEMKIEKTTITLNVTSTESGKAGDVAKWLSAVGAIVFVALVGGIVFIWHVKFRHPKLQPVQVQTIEDPIQLEQGQNEDSLHYGEISFNQSRSKPVNLAQDETVYSPVPVSNNNHRKASEMTDIYAQVKK